jgi:hypothetical protein
MDRADRLLPIDDSPQNRGLPEVLVDSHGHTAVVAYSGGECLD